jgi:hypothetical protein
MSNRVQDVIVDDSGTPRLHAEPVQARESGSPAQGGTSFVPDAVDVRLQTVEARLIALASGDAALERDVRRYLAESSARFATARVRQFVPILVEREVRDRLRARDRADDVNRTA